MAKPTASAARAIARILKPLGVALVVVLPLLTAWVASSLAALGNRPRWLAAAAGLLVFPILPLGWEWWSSRRRPATAKRRFTLRRRVVLRTLLVSVVSITGLLLAWPKEVFTALAVRGDWMLDGHHGPIANGGRRVLLGSANALGWLYELTHPNPFDDRAAVSTTTPPQERRAGHMAWPLAAGLHPAVVGMPASIETSPVAVATYLGEQEADSVQRTKAIHDYIVSRISYDVAAMRAHTRGAQSAEAAFRDRRAVCAGYAKLFIVMTHALGIEAVYLSGESRRSDGTVAAGSHAWNAVRLGEAWYLVDTTWDAGAVREDGSFEPAVSNDYLFTPPDIFAISHFPAQPAWQLRDVPSGRAEFMRGANLQPRFFALGLRLVEPDRGQLMTDGEILLRFENPNHVSLVGQSSDGKGESTCAVEGGASADVRLRCAFPRPGTSKLRIFTPLAPAGRDTKYEHLASFEVQR